MRARDALAIDWPDKYKLIIDRAIVTGRVINIRDYMWRYAMDGFPEITAGNKFLTWIYASDPDSNRYHSHSFKSNNYIVATHKLDHILELRKYPASNKKYYYGGNIRTYIGDPGHRLVLVGLKRSVVMPSCLLESTILET